MLSSASPQPNRHPALRPPYSAGLCGAGAHAARQLSSVSGAAGKSKANRARTVLRRACVFGLTLVSVLVLGGIEPASAAGQKKAKCDAGAGWAFVGRPVNLARLGPEGVYVWFEKGVWRIATTHANRRVQRVSGSITFDSPVAAKPSGSEGTFGDVSVPSPNVVNFSFTNYGGVDGISVAAPCATAVSLTASVDDVVASPSQIFVGAAGTNPTAVPLTMARSTAFAGALPGVSNVGGSSAVVVPSSPAAAAATTPLALPATSPNSVAAAAPAAGTSLACSAGGWPAVLSGRPKVLNAKVVPQGVYLWVEKNVLKVQAVVDGPQPSIVVGRISANATVTVVGVGSEGKRDTVKSDGSTVSFSLRVNRASDGFELTSLCATQFIVEATIDDVVAPLFLGANSAPIPAQPYLVAK
jgi:hypothetical protein